MLSFSFTVSSAKAEWNKAKHAQQQHDQAKRQKACLVGSLVEQSVSWEPTFSVNSNIKNTNKTQDCTQIGKSVPVSDKFLSSAQSCQWTLRMKYSHKNKS